MEGDKQMLTANKTEVNIKALSTVEFAELILNRPGIIHTFAPSLREPSCWYDVICERILEPQSVIISECCLFGEAAHMFNLPDYDETICCGYCAEQSEKCLIDMINGLKNFSNRFCNGVDSWLVKEDDLARLEINYRKIK